MALSHYWALLLSYSSALAAWYLIFRLFPGLWMPVPACIYSWPWAEVGWALVAAVATIAVGQAYTRHWLFHPSGSLAPLIESVDQALIFSPFLLLLLLRRQPPSSAWIRTDRILARILIGLALALLAIRVFLIVRAGHDGFLAVVARVYSLGNLGYAVQVLLEDIAIAILLVSLGAALRLKWAVLLTAALFAAGHIPALLTTGAPLRELANLVFDFGLAAGAIAALQRSADIWWFWCIHFAMDMMQFVSFHQ